MPNSGRYLPSATITSSSFYADRQKDKIKMARNLWLAGTSLPLHQQFFIIVLSSYQNFLLTNSCLMVFSQTLPNPIIFKPTLSPPCLGDRRQLSWDLPCSEETKFLVKINKSYRESQTSFTSFHTPKLTTCISRFFDNQRQYYLGNWAKNVAQRSRRAARVGVSRMLTQSICWPLRKCLSKGFRKSKSWQYSCLTSAWL